MKSVPSTLEKHVFKFGINTKLFRIQCFQYFKNIRCLNYTYNGVYDKLLISILCCNLFDIQI